MCTRLCVAASRPAPEAVRARSRRACCLAPIHPRPALPDCTRGSCQCVQHEGSPTLSPSSPFFHERPSAKPARKHPPSRPPSLALPPYPPFWQSFLRQEALAQAVSQLQRGLVCGVRTMSQVDATLPRAALPPGAPRPAGLGKTATAGARKVAGSSRAARRAAAAGDTAAARGAAAAAVAAAEGAAQRRREAEALVSGAEAALCNELCLPAHALARAKRTLILAAIPQGGTLGREAAVALLHPALDGARAAMVLAFCIKSGWIRQPAVAAALGTGANK